MSEIKVTLISEDFEISPGLADDGYSVGMEVMATTTPPFTGPTTQPENSAAAVESETLFVGGHPIKGRNG